MTRKHEVSAKALRIRKAFGDGTHGPAFTDQEKQQLASLIDDAITTCNVSQWYCKRFGISLVFLKSSIKFTHSKSLH
ncbi:hypothetical protein MITS9509_01763 [Synechococcus sp. MIT S9509]|nr:hypothetical protein MITS9509_01763 [Synechococcus sp. MIT S9509]